MTDISEVQEKVAVAKQAMTDAYEAEESLLKERRENRDKMSRADFRAYNEQTRDKQKKVQRDIDSAEAELHRLLNNARQEIMVGTLSEGNSAGGVK